MLSETVISSDRSVAFRQYLRDIWSYRDLLRAFIVRDLKVRYKQTVLGAVWVIIGPLLTAGIFSVIFSKVDKFSSPGLPYFISTWAGLIPWMCFSNALSQASGSLESSAGLIKKVYFPRLLAPGAMVLGTIVDFAIGWIVFNLAAAFFGFWTWWFIPFTFVLLVLQQSAAMGIGLVLGILNAQYRDVRYIVPFLLSLMMYATPVFYPLSLARNSHFLGNWAEILVSINPMVGVIETYRALLSGNYIPYKILGWNFLVAFGVLVFGVYIFKKREHRIVDIL